MKASELWFKTVQTVFLVLLYSLPLAWYYEYQNRQLNKLCQKLDIVEKPAMSYASREGIYPFKDNTHCVVEIQKERIFEQRCEANVSQYGTYEEVTLGRTQYCRRLHHKSDVMPAVDAFIRELKENIEFDKRVEMR